MLLFGQTLNFLSLFSLILSLGLLVDDAIVVVQATKQYMSTGKFTPEQAVLLVFKDFFKIILTTSLTTIFAFLPLVLATGIIGQFIRSIPITVSITLAASTVIAIVINHPMAAILERFKITKGFARILFAVILLSFFGSLYFAITTASLLIIIVSALLFFATLTSILLYRRSLKVRFEANEQAILEEKAFPEKIKARLRHHYGYDEEKSWLVKATSGIVKLDRILPTYERILNFFLNSRLNSALLIIIIIIVFAGALALPATGILKSEFLPAADSELMFVNIEGAPGLVLDQTKKVADQVEAILLKEPNIKNFSEVIGSPGINTSGSLSSAGTNQTNIAQFAINLKPLEERVNKQKSYDYAPALRKKVEAVQGAKVTLVVQSGGPPSGADFEVHLTGDDLVELERLANQYKDLLSAIPGTVNESTSLKLSSGEFTFKLKPAEMQTRGITPAQIAGTLRTAISGSEITKVLNGQDEISVEAQYNPDSVSTIDQLQSLTLTNAKGQKFPLSEVADLSLGSSLSSISRINQKRVVVLSASVEKPYLPGDVLTQFQKILVDHPLPKGYEAIFGGQNDTNTESILSILRAMSVAFILIISLLVIQFNSFRKAILVLLTIPLALTGVLYGLTLIHFTLSFPTLIGILALFGIVVKNAVILIDKININLHVGIPFKSAITDAAKSRLEAIFLTTTATIIGMIPITLYDETWEGLGAALIFGLAASTVLTLVLIPTVFNLLFAKEAARDEKLQELKKQAKQNA
jgi:HAE1 family hydrophobic/amphiphilic exporter-1